MPGIGPVSTLRVAQATSNDTDVQVIGIDPDTYLQVAAFDWNSGSTDAAVGQLRTGRWLIANGIYAAQHNLVVGQAVQLSTPNGPRTYHLAGIGNDYLNAKLSTVYTSQQNLQRDFNTTADLLLMANRTAGADPATTKALLDRVVAGYPAFRLYESWSWRAEQLKTFNSTMIIFDVLVVALALPSLLALVNTLAISVLARTREIGMLRAVGATRRQVRRMVMAESLLLSVIGTVFGAVTGLWLGYALVAAMSAVGWEMPYAFPGQGWWRRSSSASCSASSPPSDRRGRRPGWTSSRPCTRSETAGVGDGSGADGGGTKPVHSGVIYHGARRRRAAVRDEEIRCAATTRFCRNRTPGRCRPRPRPIPVRRMPSPAPIRRPATAIRMPPSSLPRRSPPTG